MGTAIQLQFVARTKIPSFNDKNFFARTLDVFTKKRFVYELYLVIMSGPCGHFRNNQAQFVTTR